MTFYRYVTPEFLDWIFNLGIQAASCATAAIANTWLNEILFDDIKAVNVPTLILHGINNEVCLYPPAVAQKNGIVGSKS